MARKRNPKIDEWKFYDKGFKVTVHAKLSGKCNFSGFLVKAIPTDRTAHFTRGFKTFEGDDLSKLRTQVEDWLEGQTDIEWEKYLLVEFDKGGSIRFGDTLVEEGLAIAVSFFQKGRDSKGVCYWRTNDKDNAHKGTYEQYIESRKRTGYYEKACAILEDTPENRESLERFGRLIVEMREAIAKYVTQDHIEEALRRIDIAKSNKALPFPLPPRTKRRKK